MAAASDSIGVDISAPEATNAKPKVSSSSISSSSSSSSSSSIER